MSSRMFIIQWYRDERLPPPPSSSILEKGSRGQSVIGNVSLSSRSLYNYLLQNRTLLNRALSNESQLIGTVNETLFLNSIDIGHFIFRVFFFSKRLFSGKCHLHQGCVIWQWIWIYWTSYQRKNRLFWKTFFLFSSFKLEAKSWLQKEKSCGYQVHIKGLSGSIPSRIPSRAVYPSDEQNVTSIHLKMVVAAHTHFNYYRVAIRRTSASITYSLRKRHTQLSRVGRHWSDPICLSLNDWICDALEVCSRWRKSLKKSCSDGNSRSDRCHWLSS